MLYLDRKKGESITIGDGITVRVKSIRGKRIRLEIDAPPEIRIDRAEVDEERQVIDKALEMIERIEQRQRRGAWGTKPGE